MAPVKQRSVSDSEAKMLHRRKQDIGIRRKSLNHTTASNTLPDDKNKTLGYQNKLRLYKRLYETWECGKPISNSSESSKESEEGSESESEYPLAMVKENQTRSSVLRKKLRTMEDGKRKESLAVGELTNHDRNTGNAEACSGSADKSNLESNSSAKLVAGDLTLKHADCGLEAKMNSSDAATEAAAEEVIVVAHHKANYKQQRIIAEIVILGSSDEEDNCIESNVPTNTISNLNGDECDDANDDDDDNRLTIDESQCEGTDNRSDTEEVAVTAESSNKGEGKNKQSKLIVEGISNTEETHQSPVTIKETSLGSNTETEEVSLKEMLPQKPIPSERVENEKSYIETKRGTVEYEDNIFEHREEFEAEKSKVEEKSKLGNKKKGSKRKSSLENEKRMAEENIRFGDEKITIEEKSSIEKKKIMTVDRSTVEKDKSTAEDKSKVENIESLNNVKIGVQIEISRVEKKTMAENEIITVEEITAENEKSRSEENTNIETEKHGAENEIQKVDNGNNKMGNERIEVENVKRRVQRGESKNKNGKSHLENGKSSNNNEKMLYLTRLDERQVDTSDGLSVLTECAVTPSMHGIGATELCGLQESADVGKEEEIVTSTQEANQTKKVGRRPYQRKTPGSTQRGRRGRQSLRRTPQRTLPAWSFGNELLNVASIYYEKLMDQTSESDSVKKSSGKRTKKTDENTNVKRPRKYKKGKADEETEQLASAQQSKECDHRIERDLPNHNWLEHKLHDGSLSQSSSEVAPKATLLSASSGKAVASSSLQLPDNFPQISISVPTPVITSPKAVMDGSVGRSIATSHLLPQDTTVHRSVVMEPPVYPQELMRNAGNIQQGVPSVYDSRAQQQLSESHLSYQTCAQSPFLQVSSPTQQPAAYAKQPSQSQHSRSPVSYSPQQGTLLQQHLTQSVRSSPHLYLSSPSTQTLQHSSPNQQADGDRLTQEQLLNGVYASANPQPLLQQRTTILQQPHSSPGSLVPSPQSYSVPSVDLLNTSRPNSQTGTRQKSPRSAQSSPHVYSSSPSHLRQTSPFEQPHNQLKQLLSVSPQSHPHSSVSPLQQGSVFMQSHCKVQRQSPVSSSPKVQSPPYMSTQKSALQFQDYVTQDQIAKAGQTSPQAHVHAQMSLSQLPPPPPLIGLQQLAEGPSAVEMKNAEDQANNVGSRSRSQKQKTPVQRKRQTPQQPSLEEQLLQQQQQQQQQLQAQQQTLQHQQLLQQQEQLFEEQQQSLQEHHLLQQLSMQRQAEEQQQAALNQLDASQPYLLPDVAVGLEAAPVEELNEDVVKQDSPQTGELNNNVIVPYNPGPQLQFGDFVNYLLSNVAQPVASTILGTLASSAREAFDKGQKLSLMHFFNPYAYSGLPAPLAGDSELGLVPYSGGVSTSNEVQRPFSPISPACSDSTGQVDDEVVYITTVPPSRPAVPYARRRAAIQELEDGMVKKQRIDDVPMDLTSGAQVPEDMDYNTANDPGYTFFISRGKQSAANLLAQNNARFTGRQQGQLLPNPSDFMYVMPGHRHRQPNMTGLQYSPNLLNLSNNIQFLNRAHQNLKPLLARQIHQGWHKHNHLKQRVYQQRPQQQKQQHQFHPQMLFQNHLFQQQQPRVVQQQPRVVQQQPRVVQQQPRVVQQQPPAPHLQQQQQQRLFQQQQPQHLQQQQQQLPPQLLRQQQQQPPHRLQQQQQAHLVQQQLQQQQLLQQQQQQQELQYRKYQRSSSMDHQGQNSYYRG